MTKKLRILIVAAAVAGVGVVSAIWALGAWAINPYPAHSGNAARTAVAIALAPFADRIVLGDSRIEMAEPTNAALFVGYSGATTRDLERLALVFCNASRAPLVFAVGINDARPESIDHEASVASVRRIARFCGANRTYLVGIWVPEPTVKPLGQRYVMRAVRRLTEDFERVAKEEGATFTPAPDLSGHTFDGVHFPPEVSERYLAFLASLPDKR